MPLKKFLPAVMALYVLALVSCQKSVSDANPPVPGSDSVTLVKTVTTVGYDDQGAFAYLARGVYDYSNAPQKVVVAVRDSDSNINDFVETYQYDNSNRLSVFTSNFFDGANRIDFQYNSGGDLTKATITYPSGIVIENTFKYQTANGHKVITLYDTANVNDLGSVRPRIVTFTFDDSSRIIKYLEASTHYNNDRSHWYSDTLLNAIVYENNGDASKAICYSTYYNGSNWVPSQDSVLYTRESRGGEIFNSSMNVCRNLYWFSLSEISPVFSQAGIPSFGNFEFTPGLYTWKHPVKQVQDWSTDSSWPPYSNGLFQNTFDANGLLTHAIYPARFGSKYDGKSILDYTYVKIKQ